MRTLAARLVPLLSAATGQDLQAQDLPAIVGRVPWLRPLSTRDLTLDIETLTLDQLRDEIAYVKEAIHLWAKEKATGEWEARLREVASGQNVLRALSDVTSQRKMAHTPAIAPVPPGPERQEDEPTRMGHPKGSRHLTLPVSTHLVGSGVVTYFIFFKQGRLQGRESRRYLVAHSSDELALYLGKPGSPEKVDPAYLSIYRESEVDPWESVDDPLPMKAISWSLYDAQSPHFAFGPEGTVSLYVAAQEGGTFADPAAFDYMGGGSTSGPAGKPHDQPGTWSSYEFPDNTSVEQAPMTFLIGRRFRNRRNIYGLTAAQAEQGGSTGKSRNVLGKLESARPPKFRLPAIRELADALDIRLPDLFAKEPLLPMPVPLAGTESVTCLPDLHSRSRFAVLPFMVRRFPQSSSEVCFREGHSDVVLLPTQGRVTVLVVLDPLRFSLRHFRFQTEDQAGASKKKRSTAAPSFVVSAKELAALESAQIVSRTTVGPFEAIQFNAALPHAVYADGNTRALVATTRSDSGLPDLWVGRD